MLMRVYSNWNRLEFKYMLKDENNENFLMLMAIAKLILLFRLCNLENQSLLILMNISKKTFNK